ncbi:MAG TPA: hypothetical protein VJV04_13375, partial [Nitrospiraceae bacterium]|nr:hypothetical protein [Nitrospiraceae bacterium]
WLRGSDSVDIQVGRRLHRVVLVTMKPGPFGHEQLADRHRRSSGITNPMASFLAMCLRSMSVHSPRRASYFPSHRLVSFRPHRMGRWPQL